MRSKQASVRAINKTFEALRAELDERQKFLLASLQDEENRKLRALRTQRAACASTLASVRAAIEESLRMLERDNFGLLYTVKATKERLCEASDNYGELEVLEPIVDEMLDFKCDQTDLDERIRGFGYVGNLEAVGGPNDPSPG